MKAITTKYYGANNYRGSRIKATDGDFSQFVSYDHGASDPHTVAALTFAKEVLTGWAWNRNGLIQGSTKTGEVFCLAPLPPAEDATAEECREYCEKMRRLVIRVE